MASVKAEYTHVGPGLPPLHGDRAAVLILGSFPSPKSREQGFFYGHPQNRFWPLMASLTGEPVPDWADIEAKKRIILDHGLAVWDTIGACDIRGASDASIRNVEPNDVAALIRRLGVQAVFCNGAASGRVYARYAQPMTGLPAAVLPSTSPANAAWSMEKLQAAWGAAFAPFLHSDG
ncbi:MAG TPA: DNA-deoxyinosine glycosylase [Candidatus Gemmiger excrementigallinarum]|uniref:DNA-deoxyinosine glycosylase n=1 Tax=Candidatus Gemmiger excrementigallinarum TaxID=2838609 RepID=A0A9D2EQ81_9FIRM|nr:DNA-deoxyinosine glycosylase [Candidatus Gemmiger excrementigallinarum]